MKTCNATSGIFVFIVPTFISLWRPTCEFLSRLWSSQKRLGVASACVIRGAAIPRADEWSTMARCRGPMSLTPPSAQSIGEVVQAHSMTGSNCKRDGKDIHTYSPFGLSSIPVAARSQALDFQCEIKIMPGLDHGTIIAGAMPDVFKFFSKHTK